MTDLKGKRFCAVLFNDGSHSVIPQKWVKFNKNKMKCFWPDDSVDRKVDSEPLSSWPIVTIKKILAESG